GCGYRASRFQLSAGVNWRSGRPYTAPLEQDNISDGNIVYQTPNSSRLDDYFRIDLSAKYLFPLAQDLEAQLGLSLWNVSGHENQINSYYEINREDEINNIRQYALGFTPNFNFRV